jgi:hypothetical protein
MFPGVILNIEDIKEYQHVIEKGKVSASRASRPIGYVSRVKA